MKKMLKGLISWVLTLTVLSSMLMVGMPVANAAIASGGEYYTIFSENFEKWNTVPKLQGKGWGLTSAKASVLSENGNYYLNTNNATPIDINLKNDSGADKYRISYDVLIEAGGGQLVAQLRGDSDANVSSMGTANVGTFYWSNNGSYGGAEGKYIEKTTHLGWIRVVNEVDFVNGTHTMTVRTTDGAPLFSNTATLDVSKVSTNKLQNVEKFKFDIWSSARVSFDNVRVEKWIKSDADLAIFEDDFNDYTAASGADLATELKTNGWAFKYADYENGIEIKTVDGRTVANVDTAYLSRTLGFKYGKYKISYVINAKETDRALTVAKGNKLFADGSYNAGGGYLSLGDIVNHKPGQGTETLHAGVRFGNATSGMFAIDNNTWLRYTLYIDLDNAKMYGNIENLDEGFTGGFETQMQEMSSSAETMLTLDSMNFCEWRSATSNTGEILVDDFKLERWRNDGETITLVNRDFNNETSGTVAGADGNAYDLNSKFLYMNVGNIADGKVEMTYDQYMNSAGGHIASWYNGWGHSKADSTSQANARLSLGEHVGTDFRYYWADTAKQSLFTVQSGNYDVKVTTDLDKDTHNIKASGNGVSADETFSTTDARYNAWAFDRINYFVHNTWNSESAGEYIDNLTLKKYVSTDEIKSVDVIYSNGTSQRIYGENAVTTAVNPAAAMIKIDFGKDIDEASIANKITFTKKDSSTNLLKNEMVVNNVYTAAIDAAILDGEAEYVLSVAAGLKAVDEGYYTTTSTLSESFVTAKAVCKAEFVTITDSEFINGAEGDTASIVIKVENGFADKAYPWAVLIGYYNADNALISSSALPGSTNALVTETKTVNPVLPDMTNVKTVKIFLWDSIAGLTPYCEAHPITVK